MASSIEVLKNPTSADQQIAALRELKNYIIGHDQRKELIVKDGAIEPLVKILSSASTSTGKRRRSDANGAASAPQEAWSQGDEARLQATLIIGALANGGPAFSKPLSEARASQVLVKSLEASIAPRLVTASLQALRNIASSWAWEGDDSGSSTQPDLGLFAGQSIDVLNAVLSQRSASSQAKQHIRLVADIVTLGCETESTRATLAQSQILDTLCLLLASHAVVNKHVDYRGDPTSWLPPPPAAAVPSVLAAISTIITNSTYRVHRFFLSSALRGLFTSTWPGGGDQRHLFGPRHGFISPAGESLLPQLHVPTYGTTTYHSGSRTFPALAALKGHERRGQYVFESVPQGGDLDHANAVCSWLLLLARSMQGHDRSIALRLLALVHNAVEPEVFDGGSRSEYIQKTREREKQMVLLAVPLAVRLVQTASETKTPESALHTGRDAKLVKEDACQVLALLVRNYTPLQIAAVDSGAIKYICPLLKKSFDNVQLAKPMWSVKPVNSTEDDLPETCKLGSRGLPPELLHAMHVRHGALQALSALSEREDLHRKAIVEAGVVGCIIDSLKPFPEDYLQKLAVKRSQASPKDGNTTAVILAACRAAKTMSRSVSLLRTSLIDAGIAKPVFQLLSHHILEVQLAATDVCINLLLEFSPMRDDLVAEGVIKTLTAHARRSSPALRLSSLWALKHLVLASPREIKVNALEELGPGWLASAVQGEQREGALSNGGVSVGLSTPNAAGEQVDLLNPSSMDVDEPADEDDDLDEDEDGEVMYDESSSTHYQASQLRSTLNPPPPAFNSKRYLSSVREAEENPALQARRDDVAIQEQALDFVRNILNGEDSTYMFDHLLQQIGSTKIFELLTAKLSPLPITARSNGGGSRTVYNPTELVLSSVHIINHISSSSPKHKQLLIAQKPLLQAWLPHFAHSDRRVRSMCVWAINSLTWIEDDSDRKDARLRGVELRNVGIEATVRNMLNDADLDVKERVKTAVRHFDQL